MNKSLSIYLDLIRFLAAILVLFRHSPLTFEAVGFLYYLKFFSTEAVMLFFVLSGYVIAFVANKKENNIKDYFISRFARLYSVLLPALILTFILDKIGMPFNSEIYRVNGYEASNYAGLLLPLIRFFANFFFLHEIWFFDIRFFSNLPLWSLAYEFWYYVIFAFAFYLKGKPKYILVLLSCLFVGPKILILFPVWLLGVFIYNLHKSNRFFIQPNTAKILFFSSIIIFLVYKIAGTYILDYHNLDKTLDLKNILGTEIGEKFKWASTALTDYLAGILFAINIFAYKYTGFNQITKLESPIRKLASMTFSLYLYHLPIIRCYSAIINPNANSKIEIIIFLIIVLISTFLLAQCTENKKYIFKKYITAIWNYLNNRIHLFTDKIIEKEERFNNSNG